jgi:hypothetical protein
VTFDYRTFFALEHRDTRGAFRVHPLGEIPEPLDVLRAEVTLSEPIRFHHNQGTRLYDFVGSTLFLQLVSERFIQVLADNDFSGWTTYKVEIYDDDGRRVPGYRGLAVTGRCGPIDADLSPVMPVPPPVPEGATLPHRIGIRFHPETWDGSEIFIPEGTGWVIVTQPVRDALTKAKITNITLTRITEIEMLVIDVN